MSPIWEGRLGGGAGGVRLFGTPLPEFYWGTFSKILLYIWNPRLKNCRLAPSSKCQVERLRNRHDDLNFEDNIPFEMKLWTTCPVVGVQQ